MSHFFVAVVVPDTTKDVQSELERLLAPYDENMEVAEYDEECWCVGRQAKDDADRAANLRIGKTISDLRDEYWAMGEDERPEWKEHIADWIRAREDAFDKHPLKTAAEEDCEECGGTGERKTTYNPKSKWDWWRVGGRWCGSIRGAYRAGTDDMGGFNFGDEFEGLGENSIHVKELIPALDDPDNDTNPCPFALVTPDGVWHERGEMGWWAVVRDEKDHDTWKAQVKALLEPLAEGHIAIGCDMHI